jgi:hypothetical protein
MFVDTRNVSHTSRNCSWYGTSRNVSSTRNTGSSKKITRSSYSNIRSNSINRSNNDFMSRLSNKSAYVTIPRNTVESIDVDNYIANII